ncbi:hypothetical protein ACFQWE_43050 [Nonomuraea recticatena]|uniref:hypothetical protein n=1 Tax=Nonomuraea recticatena TaxID=46178 RepID=UPI00361E02D5
MLRLGNPRRRINIGLIGMTFILSIFAGRLIQLQGLDSKVYEARAAQQRVVSETIKAKRGSITDVNGHELAVTVEAREIAIDPSKVLPGKRAHVAAVLAKELNKPPPRSRRSWPRPPRATSSWPATSTPWSPTGCWSRSCPRSPPRRPTAGPTPRATSQAR